jgi:hypothetical protein
VVSGVLESHWMRGGRSTCRCPTDSIPTSQITYCASVDRLPPLTNPISALHQHRCTSPPSRPS